MTEGAASRPLALRTVEVHSLGDTSVLVRTSTESFVIDGLGAPSLRRLMALADGTRTTEDIATVASTSLGIPDAAAILASLDEVVFAVGREVTPAPADLPRVAVLGAGRWSALLEARLAATGLFHVERCDVDARGTRLDALFAGCRLVVVALEGGDHERLLQVNAAALRASRAACLFTTIRAGQMVIGPTLGSARAACFVCSALSGTDTDDELRAAILELLPRLPLPSMDEVSQPSVATEAAFSLVLHEVLRVVRTGSQPSFTRSAGIVGDDLDVLRIPVAPVAECPQCAGAAAAFVGVDRPLSWSELFTGAAPDVAPTTPDAASLQLQACLIELDARGAGRERHSILTLRDHLLGARAILASWGQSAEVIAAGLFHSGYGTSAFETAIFAPADRRKLRALLGEAAERLVYLFCTVDRRALKKHVAEARAGQSSIRVVHRLTKESLDLPLHLAQDVMTIELANAADQAHDGELGPAAWVAEASRDVAALRRSGRRLPLFSDGSVLDDADEERALALYRRITGSPGPALDSLEALQAVTKNNPWVGEPLVLLAEGALAAGRPEEAARAASAGIDRLTAWGTSWDKRAPFEEWIERAWRARSLATAR